MSALTESTTPLSSFEKSQLGFSWIYPNIDLRIEDNIDGGEGEIKIVASSLFIKTGVTISAKKIEFEATEGSLTCETDIDGSEGKITMIAKKIIIRSGVTIHAREIECEVFDNFWCEGAISCNFFTFYGPRPKPKIQTIGSPQGGFQGIYYTSRSND